MHRKNSRRVPGIGIMEDFDYILEETVLEDELILYTDGITDANNTDNEMYGEERLLKFFNEFKEDSNPIEPLLNDIDDSDKLHLIHCW